MTEVLAHGRYSVQRRLATGGMGEVLLASFDGDADVTPGLLVVKRILSAAPGQPPAESQVRMLLEEGRLGLRLSHENLVETFRIDADEGSPLLVIELLAGRSMAQVLGQAKKQQKPVPVDVALAVLRGACCGLHFAHTLKGPDGTSLGLVHRDVSPANIFVTFDGKVKVIDFGVAKSDDSEVKTATGILKGKLGYMSPEQSLGASKLTPQADVWSLGVFFWEMLLAERLFSSPNPTATLLQITQKEVPRPRTLRPDVPPAVEAIAMRMLARPLEDRFTSCAEVARAIDAVVEYDLDQTDVGAFVAGRFPDEAVAGAADAARCARRRGRQIVARGIEDGSAGVDPAEDDELATAILPAGLREQLLASVHGAAPVDDDDDNAATIRVDAGVVARIRAGASAGATDEDDIQTRRVDGAMVAQAKAALSQTERNPLPSSMITGSGSMPVASRPAEPPAPRARSGLQVTSLASPTATTSQTTPAVQPGAQRSAMASGAGIAPAPSSLSSPSPSSLVSNTLPVVPQGARVASARIRPQPTSWLAVAVGTFGALVVLMGAAFALAMQAPVPHGFVTWVDPAGFSVIAADATQVPPGRPSELLNLGGPSLLRAGETNHQLVDPGELEQRLKEAGVWKRATLPTTTKAKTAALLPLLLVGIGVLALSFAIPAALLHGGARLGLQATLMVLTVVVVVALLQRGALSWPGYAAFASKPVVEWR